MFSKYQLSGNARVNKSVFNMHLKHTMDSGCYISITRLFHMLGATTKKTLLLVVWKPGGGVHPEGLCLLISMYEQVCKGEDLRYRNVLCGFTKHGY